ncbi:MAG: hypothetical protein NUV54_02335 [Candidatus Taylorbacteria bacterium]|nr:hypothetical protein [Candidatus Taylorbacteria bacterium]
MLSEPIAVLLEKLKNQKRHRTPSPDDVAIHVNKITEKAGAAYEKIRYLVDYKDERHIRRSAIERIIKRKILLEKEEGIGLSLIQELIAGRYLQNDSVPEEMAKAVEKIVLKYKTFERHLPEHFRSASKTRTTVVSLLGSEIEEFFYPNNEDDYVADAFFATVRNSVKVDADFDYDFTQTQIHIACYRCLLNVDDETLRFKFWLKCMPDEWLTLEDEAEIARIAEKGEQIWHSISLALVDPLSFRLIPRLGNYAIYFSAIREVIRAYGAESEQILSNQAELDSFIADFLAKNYEKQHSRSQMSALRAVIYIFFTKMLLALALEVPYQIYVEQFVNYTPLAINVVFHPVLLLVVTVSAKKLGDENTKAIQTGVHNILLNENIRPIKVPVKQAGFFNTIFFFLYSALFLVVFGAIVFALRELGFSVVSTLLFLCFLALVSYFALRIRHSANRFKVAKEDSRTVALAFNLFALPIIRAGRWLSRTFSSINVFVFVLDFIIETPFKLVLHLGDAFVSFLKEKQEDVY